MVKEGVYVIPWDMCEVDGAPGAALDGVIPGAHFRWRGAAVCVGEVNLRPMIRRQLTDWLSPPVPHNGFTLTDGRNSYALSLGPSRGPSGMIAICEGRLPPSGEDLWIVETCLDPRRSTGRDAGKGVICFVPGARIATPSGPRDICELRPGDMVLTKDNGPQPVLWTGSRRISGARLFAEPALRPVRIAHESFGLARPDAPLIVSRQHRMLIAHRSGAALFGETEVLVRASDLVDGLSVTIDSSCRDVTYVHLLLEQHQVIWANGLETESLHPAATELHHFDPALRAQLTDACPAIAEPAGYGAFVRRMVSSGEAALLPRVA